MIQGEPVKTDRRQIVRFLVVGALNTAFGYSLFAFLVFIHLPIEWALLIATLLGVVFNFKTMGPLVFGHSDNSVIGRFALVYGVIYTVNLGCLKGLVALGVSPYLASALLIAPIAVLSFVLNKRFVFRPTA